MSPARQPRTVGKLPAALQVVCVVATGVAMLGGSAALAWSLRRWRENPVSPAVAATTVAPNATRDGDRHARLLRAGRLAYHVHCARCHGAEGHGDGADAERLNPPPRDFASGNWRLGPTESAVRQAIVAGIPGTAMPGWGASLSRNELDALIAHVLSLAPARKPVIDEISTTPSEEPPIASPLEALLKRAGFVAEATPRPAPALTIQDLDGTSLSLQALRGRPVLLLFWGTTCSHCLSELPAAIRFAAQYQAQGLEILPVCTDETDPAVVRQVAGPQPERRPIYVDPRSTASHRFDIQVLPTAVLIDPAGRILGRATGTRDWTDPALDELVRHAFPSSEPGSP